MEKILKIMFILFFILLLNPANGHAAWFYRYPSGSTSVGYAVQQTLDGGFIIGGYVITSTLYEDRNARLIKTDGSGNRQWEKTYGGSDVTEYGYGVEQTIDGGYIIVGLAQFSNFTEGSYFDVWLVKTDGSGNVQWDKRHDNGGNDELGYSVQQTSDGGFIVVGTSNYLDVLLIKTDASGNQQWLKTYDYSGSESGYSVRQASDGGYIIAGGISIGAGDTEVLLLKTNADGNEQWHKTYGGIGDVAAQSVRQTTDDGYILTGAIQVESDNRDLWLMKTDSAGNKQWEKTYGGNQRDFGYDVRQTNDGGYAVSGTTTGLNTGLDIWLVKTDASGNRLWDVTQANYGEDQGYGMDLTEDGGYVIAGVSSSWLLGDHQACLVKIDVPKMTAITLQSPDNGATISSPPTFTWLPNGGTDNAFAVDISFSSRMRNYWSTYNKLGIEITGNNWTPSEDLWNQIGSRRTVYWRVRGVDRSKSPMKVIYSETRSFFKP